MTSKHEAELYCGGGTGVVVVRLGEWREVQQSLVVCAKQLNLSLYRYKRVKFANIYRATGFCGQLHQRPSTWQSFWLNTGPRSSTVY